MPDSQNFNTNKDINRYLQQQGRAPQSHLDWETWRKVGQPGTYQAPPGSGQRFQGVSSGAGGPSYSGAGSNYNMFKDTGDAIASALTGPTSWVQNKFARMGKDKPGSTASSRNGSNMADDNGSMGPSMAGGGRSQNASITSPASSRGMRRSRGGDFSGALAAHNITMVQGNDNYGTVNGNMGGANVGNGDYDNSFQSKNSGGRQTAFSGNNNTFGGGSPTPPVNPTPPTPPPTPPVSPYPPPPTPNGPNTPVGPGKPPKTPKTYVTDEDWEGIKRPPLTPMTPPNGIGTRPVGPQTPVAGPQQPGRPAIGAGPQPSGAIESGIKGELTGKDIPAGLAAHANDKNGGPESATAVKKVRERGVQGPWISETANSGPQAPAAGPMSQPVEGPVNPAASVKGRKINEQGGVGARKYGPAKPKPAQGPVEGPKSSYAQVKERNQKNANNKKAEPIGAAGKGTTAGSGSKSTVKTMGKGKK